MLDLLKKRRSIRAFKDKEIEKEKIQQIMKAVLLSPSSKNNNPWKFLIVQEKDLLLKLSKAKAYGSQFVANAPLALVVLADPSQSDVWIEDCSIASTIVLLTAQALDLGSCWIQIRKRKDTSELNSEKYIKELLQIPDNLRIPCMVAIGYPDEKKSEKQIAEEKLNDIYLNKYGDLWESDIY
jgi:nitroreductase